MAIRPLVEDRIHEQQPISAIAYMWRGYPKKEAHSQPSSKADPRLGHIKLSAQVYSIHFGPVLDATQSGGQCYMHDFRSASTVRVQVCARLPLRLFQSRGVLLMAA